MPNTKQVVRNGVSTQILQRGMPLTFVGQDIKQVAYCCLPKGCTHVDQSVPVEQPGDAVKVACNNDQCPVAGWMHKECFTEWEELVLTHLKSSGRARSWTDKQCLQNLWTKKGYDLVYKACDCRCGKGHLRKDLDYSIPVDVEDSATSRLKKKANIFKTTGKALDIGLSKNGHIGGLLCGSYPGFTVNPRLPFRGRTSSLSSTGSSGSPPSSAGTPPMSAGTLKKRFDFFTDPAKAAAGNIFRRRTDYSMFGLLPRHQQNPYHIKMEDEGPHGNDETRCFVLTNLSTHQVTNAICVTCGIAMPIFDTYPLIDGTFFLSPQRYNSDIQVLLHQRMLYLSAVCLACMQGRSAADLRCVGCSSSWFGQAFVVGSMYAFDVFSAIPCCRVRYTCKNCHRLIMDPTKTFPFFSEYSKPIQCPHCMVEDYHFIKPMEEIFRAVKNN